MKRFITIIAAMIIAASASAATKSQNDTIVLPQAVLTFRSEAYQTSTGKDKTRYIATYKGKDYHTTKTAAERYADIKRWSGVPCVIKITTPSGAERIAVL
jgi:hypothetical protein